MILVEVKIRNLDRRFKSHEAEMKFLADIEKAIKGRSDVSESELVVVAVSNIRLCNIQNFVQVCVASENHGSIEIRCMGKMVVGVIEKALGEDNNICHLAA